jgi:hypothetical protein
MIHTARRLIRRPRRENAGAVISYPMHLPDQRKKQLILWKVPRIRS